ncbi:alpha/beta fold hydrolase [Streptomyces sp. YGL11-2]|uniref:alpha/beta fold hydrolase n=1 Tax=Streptomyces sp. YGL11-2 TaxID=3414028 RepID=UPI003CEAAD4D
MPIATTPTARIPYRVAGEGPGLLLVHGTGPGAEINWGHLVDQFTDRHSVLLPNYSGSDSAEDDGGELSVEKLAEQIAAVIEHAGGEPVDLVGFSLGSVVAAAVAATRPVMVRSLVLVAPWLHRDEYMRNLFTVWRRIGDFGDAEAFGRFAAVTGFSRPFLDGFGTAGVDQLATNMSLTKGILRHLDLDLRVDIRELATQIQARTLVIGGTQDVTVPVEHARAVHAAVPGSSYAEVDAGHVMVIERQEEFVKLVRDFTDGG